MDIVWARRLETGGRRRMMALGNASLQQGKIGLFEIGIKVPKISRRSSRHVQILQMNDEILHPLGLWRF
jgi:hypothetical protein